MNIIVREMAVKDAEAVNALSRQLGYPLRATQTQQNITIILQSEDHTAFVAEHGDKIIGWIGVAQATMIEVMPHCEINGLVIDEAHRGMGVGKLLISKVKQWAKEKGNDRISLHCNVKRTEAHLFYQHLGFSELKQQKNFVLDL